MFKKIKNKFKKNFEIFSLLILIIITAVSTTYFNYIKKETISNTYTNFIDNIYLKKTLNHIIDNLEPKYQKFNHKIKSGETFDKILNSYSVDRSEIIIVKKCLFSSKILQQSFYITGSWSQLKIQQGYN